MRDAPCGLNDASEENLFVHEYKGWVKGCDNGEEVKPFD